MGDLMKWHTHCKLVVDQPMKLSTTGLPAMKSAHDGPQLTELRKEKCCNICKQLLDHCGTEGDHFLERIVTEDETWIHQYEPESKHQSVEWKHPHLPAKKKFKTYPTAGKLLLTVFVTHKSYYWNIGKKGVQQRTVLATVRCCVTS